MNNRIFIIALFFLSICNVALSQEQDFQLWTELGIKKSFNKKVSILFSQEYRFNENATMFDKWHSTLGAEYKFNKYLKVRASYRYTQNEDVEEGNQPAHRVLTDLILRQKVKRFSLTYRLRYQMDFERDFSGEGLYLESAALRNKFGVKYNVRKLPLLPFASYEFLYRLNNPNGNSIENNRFTIGCEYGFTKNLDASLFYRYQMRSGNDVKAKEFYILGLGASYRF